MSGKTSPEKKLVNFVSTRIIPLKTCGFCQDKQTNVCVGFWSSRKYSLFRKRSQLRPATPFMVIPMFDQSEESETTQQEVSLKYREQLEYETLQSLDWFPICEKVAEFCHLDKVRQFVAQGMKVNQWSKEQTQQYLMETDDFIRFMQSGFLPTQGLVGAHLLENIVEKTQKGLVLNPKELYQVASTITVISLWKKSLESQSTTYPHLYALVQDVETLSNLEDSIYQCIDDKEQVKDEASTQLYETRIQIRKTSENIKQILRSLLQQCSEFLQEPVFTERFGRFVIPVKVNYKNRVSGIVQDVSSSGLTLYIEPNSITSLTNRLQQLGHMEQEAVEEILIELTRKVGQDANYLLHISKVVFHLDWVSSRAQFSRQINGRLPTIVDSFHFWCTENVWKLVGVRHPLLLLDKSAAVVPIDYEIRSGVTAVCITGPNTGGKTVALKTFGVVILMTKVGLFVPCLQENITIPFFEDVFADIGDHQSVIQSVSTFSSHILRIQRISQLCHKHSLVLLDEIGTGTDPVQGYALAMSILLYLVERVGFLMTTTHHGQLKTLKYKDTRFENASVEFDTSSLQPTYRLLWGIAGRSCAIDIAQRLGLDKWIIKNARDMVKNESDKISIAVEDMERTKEQFLEWKAQLERKEKSLELLEQQLLSKERHIQQLEQEWIETKVSCLCDKT